MPQEEHMIQFALRLPNQLLVELKRVAADADRTPSAEIRQLIRRHVEPKGLTSDHREAKAA